MRRRKLTCRGIAPHARLGAMAVGLVASVLLFAGDTFAVTHLKRGTAAPPIVLDTIAGQRVVLGEPREQPVVVMFGELYHDRTLRASGEIREALASPAFAGHTVTFALVIAQDATKEELEKQAADPRLPSTVLHDGDRATYGAYRVSVMPSVVVIDARGRVVHAVAGYTARLEDIVADAVRVALGEMTPEQFDQRLHPETSAPVDDILTRASRVSSLARQLARRGLDQLAEEKYREALKLAPDFAPARLGLAMVLLRQRRLAVAETEFRAAADADPSLVQASLGLAYVLTLRGGEELNEAERVMRTLIHDRPDEPRAHYVLGLIHEQRDEPAEAIAAFRHATEILMRGSDGWNVDPEQEEP